MFDPPEQMKSLILNFHGVGPVPRAVDQGELNCWLDIDFFEAVLDLVGNRNCVGITVDDGNESDFSHILPALAKRNLRGKFFICSGRLNHPTFLNRGQIHALLAAGMEIGSHGMNHSRWRCFSPPQLDHELQTSRRILEEVCGAAILEAACPFGSYDRKVLAALRRAGYNRVYTSDGGFSGDRTWIVPRTTVTRLMTLDDVRNLVDQSPSLLNQVLISTKRLCKRLR